MNEETSQKHCPKCKALISPDAPGGLCPHCLLQFVAMSTGGADFPDEDRSPPNIESIRIAFPQLEILDVIGQGGMGAVYKARQPKLDRIVALKILPLRLARELLFAERFEREGRLLARLNHPNIVGVYDFGQAGEFYYLIMEYVDGVNLRQAFASSRFTPQQALSVIPKICEALQFAHDEGVLHRDIKPENILLDTKGRVKIADFGIAKFSGVDDKTGLTATGATIGTPHYMAPEQIEQPANVDHRADIFSLGVVFYEMLTGELPLGRFSAPSERTKSLDARIDNVVMRALEKDRERRQQSANEVRTEVELLGSRISPLPTCPPKVPAPPILTSKQASTPHSAAISSATNYSARPTIAIALILASVLLPITVAMQHNGPNDKLLFWLALLSAWFSIPGTLIGIRHLSYVVRSGNREGSRRAVVASMFWLCVIFVIWTQYFSDGIAQQFSFSGPADRFSVSFVALIVGISISVIGMWAVAKQVQRLRPDPNYLASKVSGGIVTAIRLLITSVAISIWIFFGCIIVYLMPSPKDPGRMLATTNQPISPATPDPVLSIYQVTTKENVLLVVVTSGLPGDLGMGMGDEFRTGKSSMENMMGGTEGMMGAMSGMEDEGVVKLQVEFRGDVLQPDAQVLAAESFKGKCYYPSEPPEFVSLVPESGVTLAFALPNSATAVACMNKIQRDERRRKQGRNSMGPDLPGQLFSINSNNSANYEAFVTIAH